MKDEHWTCGRILKGCLNSFGVLLLMFALAMGALYGTYHIKRSAIVENVDRSCAELAQETSHPVCCGFKLWRMDNFTDCIMVQMAKVADDANPLRAMMSQDVYGYDDMMRWDPVDLANLKEEDGKFLYSYARYWHGHQLFLRPLFTITDYHGIKLINVVLLSLLSVLSFILISRRLGAMPAWTFACSLLILNPFIIPFCMLYSICFYVSLIVLMVILLFPHTFNRPEKAIPLFVLSGAATSFFDLLTTPQLSWGLPLIALLYANKEMRTLKVFLVLSVAWSVGYAGFWVSKWGIAELILGEGVIEDAVQQFSYRSSNFYRGHSLTFAYAMEVILSQLQARHLMLPVIGGITAGVAVMTAYFLMVFERKSFKENAYLLLIAAGVPVWYIMIRNHSFQHGCFTWRALLVSIWAIMLFVISTARPWVARRKKS